MSQSTWINHDEHVRFMRYRAADILVTDLKKPLVGSNKIGLGLNEGAGSEHVLFLPLMLVLNILRSWPSFKEDVVDLVLAIGADRAKTGLTRRSDESDYQDSGLYNRGVYGTVNMDATIRARAESGNHKLVRMVESGLLLYGDRRLAALVVEEFIGHCCTILKERGFLKGELKKRLFSPLDRLESLLIKLKDVWEEGAHVLQIDFEAARSSLAPHLEVLANCFRSKSDSTHYLREYIRRTKPVFERARRFGYRFRCLVDWRNNFVTMRTGLGPGNRLLLDPTRNRNNLFELWCFVELARVLVSMGRHDLVQLSMLSDQASNPLFATDEGEQIYYDFFANRLTNPPRGILLPNARVEWFIKNPVEWCRSVVIDAKNYERWNSGENLKVLGYMNNFGVDRGVVIFRCELPAESYGDNMKEDGFALCRFGRNRERIFCALTLRPEEGFMERNRELLQRLVEKIVLPPLQVMTPHTA
ncbi:MAG: hypothetical protein GY928_17220 [Colwellia sp.]|nr:hypothetical protein [Colwellia sp.]